MAAKDTDSDRESLSLSDWEDLGDDRLSVRSLPEDDEEYHDCNTQASSPIPIPASSATAAAAQTPPALPSTVLPVAATGAATSANVDPLDLFSTADVEQLSVSDGASISAKNILQRLAETRMALLRVESALHNCGTAPNVLTTQIQDNIVKACKQAEMLAVIVGCYERVWNTEIPLDTQGLAEWATKMHETALQLKQATVEYRLEIGEGSWVSTLMCRLSKLSEDMEEFLPIIQADFNEFQTGTRGADVRTLRRELYILKDKLARAKGHLNDHIDAFPQLAKYGPERVTSALGTVYDTITDMLTNHPSEWIESGLQGGLTYADFASLDIDLLRMMTGELQQVLVGLDGDVDEEADEDHEAWTEETQDNFVRILLEKGGYLTRLEAVAQVLGDLFKLGLGDHA